MNRRHEGVTAEAIEAQMEFIQSTAPGLHPTELANIKNALSHKAEHTTASVARIRELHRRLELSMELYESHGDKNPSAHCNAVRSALAKYQSLIRAIDNNH